MDKIVKLSWSILFVSLVLVFLACSDDSSSNTGRPEDESAESMENDKSVAENGDKDAGAKDGEGTGVNGDKDDGSKDGEGTDVNGDKDESVDATGVCGTETYDLKLQRCGEGDVVETACGSGESAVWYVADGSKVCESDVVKGVCGTETYDLETQRCGEGDVVETACGSGESAVWYDPSKFFCDTRDKRDKQLYGFVRIANSKKAQVWMTKNMNYEINSGSWCYSSSGSNCTKYGRLYTWSAASSACPPGWRLPSTSDWETLFDIVGGKSTAAKKLKSKSWNGTDNYGFSALPGGSYDGTRFNNAGSYGFFWTSTADNDRSAQSIDMSSYDSPTENSYVKSKGFSARCLKK